jgi:hypothetical protein
MSRSTCSVKAAVVFKANTAQSLFDITKRHHRGALVAFCQETS